MCIHFQTKYAEAMGVVTMTCTTPIDLIHEAVEAQAFCSSKVITCLEARGLTPELVAKPPPEKGLRIWSYKISYLLSAHSYL